MTARQNRTVLYPGSFDPLTRGHLDLIRRAAKIFDRVYVGVLVNPHKKSLFSVEERVIIIRNITKDIPRVEVVSFSGLLVDFCRQLGISHILRGLRDSADFEAEIKVAQGLTVLEPGLDTVFLGTDLRYAYLSSSMVREVASGGGDVSAFVPEGIAPLVAEKYGNSPKAEQ
jgi:pantetheine-phosphate adenylyltransferase